MQGRGDLGGWDRTERSDVQKALIHELDVLMLLDRQTGKRKNSLLATIKNLTTFTAHYIITTWKTQPHQWKKLM